LVREPRLERGSRSLGKSRVTQQSINTFLSGSFSVQLIWPEPRRPTPSSLPLASFWGMCENKKREAGGTWLPTFFPIWKTRSNIFPPEIHFNSFFSRLRHRPNPIKSLPCSESLTLKKVRNMLIATKIASHNDSRTAHIHMSYVRNSTDGPS
jgi:hypothetical protein